MKTLITLFSIGLISFEISAQVSISSQPALQIQPQVINQPVVGTMQVISNPTVTTPTINSPSVSTSTTINIDHLQGINTQADLEIFINQNPHVVIDNQIIDQLRTDRNVDFKFNTGNGEKDGSTNSNSNDNDVETTIGNIENSDLSNQNPGTISGCDDNNGDCQGSSESTFVNIDGTVYNEVEGSENHGEVEGLSTVDGTDPDGISVNDFASIRAFCRQNPSHSKCGGLDDRSISSLTSDIGLGVQAEDNSNGSDSESESGDQADSGDSGSSGGGTVGQPPSNTEVVIDLPSGGIQQPEFGGGNTQVTNPINRLPGSQQEIQTIQDTTTGRFQDFGL